MLPSLVLLNRKPSTRMKDFNKSKMRKKEKKIVKDIKILSKHSPMDGLST